MRMRADAERFLPPGLAPDAASPVTVIPGEPARRPLPQARGLCLSGGGYRAMLFHLGALWRLNELGELSRLDRVSSVSGGSVTAGVLAHGWGRLAFDAQGRAENFEEVVVRPVRALAGRTLDLPAILLGLLTRGGAGARLADALDRHLFGGACLSGLPVRPRFVFNAANLQSGVLWRFSREAMADWRVGTVRRPRERLAVAVAASAAFPPFLSPVTLRLSPGDFERGSGDDLETPEYQRTVVLTDGGLYDNLGLETCFRECGTVWVSDAGGRIGPTAAPPTDWVRQGLRASEFVYSQVRGVRLRQLIAAYKEGARRGAYWGIRTDLSRHPVVEGLRFREDPRRLARLPTRFKGWPAATQEALVNWGYAVCAASAAKHGGLATPAATRVPYPHA
jgi:NTE family protein